MIGFTASCADSPTRNIVKGIFNSEKGNLIQNVASIPCDTIETLESDADEAEQFVNQIQAGQVPSVIANLPQEAVSEFGDIIEVATMVIDDIAEAAVTDVINVVNEIEDGSIVSVIEGIPEDIIDAITNGWDDFTSGVESVWGDVTCFFEGGCSSTSSSGFCAMPASASASATDNAAAASSAAAAGAAYTSAFYASESSADAAAYTSAFYASESSADAAAYASSLDYYSTAELPSYSSVLSAYSSSISSAGDAAYTSAYYASESSAAAASAADQQAYPAQTTLQAGTPTVVRSPATQQGQNTLQSTSQASSPPTQSTQPSSKATSTYDWSDFNYLSLAALTVFGLALWL